ncbi:hypothetical protein B4N89_20840 [Embleya scabrispora]|uniref:Uncharacterized protein n=1 Tax=Embleya scabrispora TaxID=159449 RepID=A0A1T3P2E0_9ACTN|nr:hypothetical protein [Embleya scabrispora]OPC83060.1 hypothetical protein B4N89_20840 [Embleya scabrispora]
MIRVATERDDLSRLVREAHDAGASYGEIAQRAVDPESGETLSKPYIARLAHGQVDNPPRASMLRALAAGLRLPVSVVKAAAAAQWMEYVATGLTGYGDDVRIIVAHLGDMSEDEVARFRRLVESWRE